MFLATRNARAFPIPLGVAFPRLARHCLTSPSLAGAFPRRFEAPFPIQAPFPRFAPKRTFAPCNVQMFDFAFRAYQSNCDQSNCYQSNVKQLSLSDRQSNSNQTSIKPEMPHFGTHAHLRQSMRQMCNRAFSGRIPPPRTHQNPPCRGGRMDGGYLGIRVESHASKAFPTLSAFDRLQGEQDSRRFSGASDPPFEIGVR